MSRDRSFSDRQDMTRDAAKRADQIDSAQEALKTLGMQIVQLEREIAIETENMDHSTTVIADIRMADGRTDLTRPRNALSITHQWAWIWHVVSAVILRGPHASACAADASANVAMPAAAGRTSPNPSSPE